MQYVIFGIVLYIIDVIVFGSILGLINVFGYGIENILNGANNNLWHSYLKGVAFYWFIDTVISKFKLHYYEAKELQNDT